MTIPDHIEKLIRENLDKESPTKLEGWMTPERGLQFVEHVLEHKPKVVVEIGVFGGRSMLCYALALRQLNEGGVYYGIDPWEIQAVQEGETVPENREWNSGVDWNAIHLGAMNVIWKHNLDKWAVVVRSASHHCHGLFQDIDLLAIDGSHVESVAVRDVELYLPKLKPGGYLFFDDSDWPSTQKAIKLVEQSCDLIRDDGRETHNSLYRKRFVDASPPSMPA